VWLPCTADARLGECIRAAAWRWLREVAAALCVQQEGESPAPAVRPKAGWTLGPGGGAIRVRAARRRRCASPAPACAACAARALRSSSARELSQRFAPPRAHWPAARAASQWSGSGAASRAAPGLPAEPQPPECGRRPLGSPRPAGQRGPGGSDTKVGGDGGGRGSAAAGGGGRAGAVTWRRLTWVSRCGQVAQSPAKPRSPGSHAPGGRRARSLAGTSPGCWGQMGREEGAAAPRRCLRCPYG
jgi:translation initiation factor IF-2